MTGSHGRSARVQPNISRLRSATAARWLESIAIICPHTLKEDGGVGQDILDAIVAQDADDIDLYGSIIAEGVEDFKLTFYDDYGVLSDIDGTDDGVTDIDNIYDVKPEVVSVEMRASISDTGADQRLIDQYTRTIRKSIKIQ